MVQLVAEPRAVHVLLAGLEVTRYWLILEPPMLRGGFQLTVTAEPLREVFTPVGELETARRRAGLLGADI